MEVFLAKSKPFLCQDATTLWHFPESQITTLALGKLDDGYYEAQIGCFDDGVGETMLLKVMRWDDLNLLSQPSQWNGLFHLS